MLFKTATKSAKNYKFLKFLFAIIFFAGMLVLFRLIQVLAFTPSEINFQGKITDSNGVNVANGNYDFRIRIYDAASGGNELYNTDLLDVEVENGVFNLKFSPSNAALGANDTYLQVCFNSDKAGSVNNDSSDGIAACNTGSNDKYDRAFTPRKKITSNPYSLMSKFLGSTNISADTAGNLTVGGNATITGTTTFNGQTYTWPSSSSGTDYVLKNNGSGNLSWSAVTSGTVTGITAGAGLSGGTINQSGTISLNTSNSNTWGALQTFNNGLTLGSTSTLSLTGTSNQVVFGSGVTGTLTWTPVTSSKIITLPNETGTVCTTGSVCTGYQASGSYLTAESDTLGSVTGRSASTSTYLNILGGATIQGAQSSINSSSNFATNINTGTSTGAVSIGGGAGTVAISATNWGITTGGNITTSGTAALTSLSQGSIAFIGSSGVISQNNSQLFWNNTNSRLGVGTSNPGGKLEVSSSSSITDSNQYAVRTGINQTVASSFTITGIDATTTLSSNTVDMQQGLNSIQSIVKTSNSGGGISFAKGVSSWADNAAGKTIGDLRLFEASNPSNSGTITSLYGLYISNMTAGVTNYGIYSDGATKSYFGGNVGIGVTNASSKLEVDGNIFSDGSSAGFRFRDRTATTRYWQWYGTGDTAYFYNGSSNIVTLSNTGLMTLPGGLNVSGGSAAFTPSINAKGGISNSNATYLQIDGGTSAYTYFSGAVGMGITSPNGQLHIKGSGQATASPTIQTSSSALGSTLVLQDTGNSPNNGGLLVFGAANGHFAGIKGLLNNGSSNTTGDLIFLTRNAVADSTLAERVRISQTGNITMGVGITSGSTTMDIGGTQTSFAVCHSGTTATTDNVGIVDCGATPFSDYMEMYPVDNGVQMGDIVVTSNNYAITTDGDRVSKLSKSSGQYQNSVIGVISDKTKAGDFNSIGYNLNASDNPQPIALNGRVPVKVTSINGNIEPGDLITTSNTPGVGMKATSAGFVVGKALESYSNVDTNAIGYVMVYINNSYYNPSSTTITSSSDWTLTGDTLSSDFNVAVNGDLGVSGSINSNAVDSQTLSINTNKLTIDANGNLVSVGSIQSNSVVTAVLNATNATITNLKVTKLSVDQAALNPTTASGVIPAGEQTIVVPNTNVTTNSKIFVTITSDSGDSLKVIQKVNGTSFTVKLNTIAASDVTFDYWIVGE